MQPPDLTDPNARSLFRELALATRAMKRIPAKHLCSGQWQVARARQEHAFERWHGYLKRQAGTRKKYKAQARAQ
ncbi:hypothetical protein [Pseudomonas typographi]|uniref:hypothetical protein n=1 Tax=Pseudomonas typographi TaxID=2715964 RepID=UPI001682B26D|nr:hypothetical protein [Pseudomonas typographi]MBD1551180.1 hypothetical protein [Pseudomonas typographi]MBD1586326.1 hypothetical protein [Pseudomonas typographi]